MTLGGGIRYFLAHGNTSVVTTRIHPEPLRPNEALPVVLFTEINTKYIDSQGGASNLRKTVVQLDCVDAQSIDADALREAVVLDFEGAFSGVDPGDFDGLEVQGCRVLNSRAIRNPMTDKWHSIVEVEIWWQPATAS